MCKREESKMTLKMDGLTAVGQAKVGACLRSKSLSLVLTSGVRDDH